MVEGRRGLGRGLSALLGEADDAAAADAAADAAVLGAREIPIELLRRNPDQPRRSFPEAELAELADSIREKGILQPVLVRPAPGADGEYQLVAGERRWRAAQLAGLRVLPAVVRELSDLDVLEIGIIENVQRADLNPMEEALGYRALMDRFGRTQEQVSQTVGKSRSHVANTLRLLSLPAEVQTFVSDGLLSQGHARAIATAAEPLALAKQIIERGLSVRDTEAMAREAQPRAGSPAKVRRAAPVRDADTEALERDLSDSLGLTVQIIDRGGVGEVRVVYSTLEQLDDLCRRLSRN
ncbi:MAG: chromosome partitioning protein ParB [Caulobacter sp.]|nr:chromosome partitioning protein ParB [Caulobacter sp.]